MEQKFKTIEEIKEWHNSAGEGSDYSFSGLLTYVEHSIGESPIKPNKPYLPQKHTANDAKCYAMELLEYESDLIPKYQKKLKEFNEIRDLNNKLIEELIKDETAFYSVVPDYYREKLFSYAYQQGHSGGWSEICNVLNDLITIFE